MRWLLSLSLFIFLLTPAFAQREYGFDNTKPSGQPYLKPEESVARMKAADGFEVKLFAAEPDVVNPVAMTVDEKGRVWVIECFEYPKRTPKGKMPRDRIVILEDTKGTGVCDKRTVFAEGKDFPVSFDMASGLEVGNGGVYVGAPPYLFFIENKNDKPGKFEVLLKGFGSQDTHETLNTFQWGPDGWLYGLHGIFTNSEVKANDGPAANAPGVKINGGVWRFHPKTKKFEIFAEGTSNPWGMDWRNTDGQFILCCCVIPHLFHIVPGGIYKRQAGQSFNPYAYGEIKEICDHTFHKESGWAHAGLISLDTPIMPEKFRNSVIFGSIHGCSIKQNILKPNGSSFTASRGDDFLVSGDKNFRPINLRWGPNGEIYCIDWHDQNPCHQAGPDSWDYEHGRVFRIQTKRLKTTKAEDLGKKTDEELVALFNHPNPYVYRTALRLFRETANAKRAMFIRQSNALVAGNLRWLWADHEFPREGCEDLLFWSKNHPELSSKFHSFAVRFFGESRDVSERGLDLLKDLAVDETSPAVRREIASTAERLATTHDTASIVHALMKHKEDAKDPVIPLLLWLAYEKQISKSLGKELDWLRDNAANNALIADYLIPRTMRRLVATGKPEDLAVCVAFLGEVKDAAAKQRALEGLVLALQSRQVDAPSNWNDVRVALSKEPNQEIQNLVNKLSINFRDPEAVKRALAVALDAGRPIHDRMEAVRSLALARPDTALQPLIKLAISDSANELRVEAIRALASFDAPAVPMELLANYEGRPKNLKGEIVNVLAGRKEWAKQLLEAVGQKKVERTDLNNNTIMRIQALKDKNLDAMIDKVWGRIRKTPAELEVVINKTRAQLFEAPASFARGKIAFDTHCAKCHKFEGRGFEVGPNIEGASRDIEYLLVNVLDPNRVIGAPYFIRTVTKLNGQNEIGLLAAEDDQSITLKTENAVLKVIQKKEIDEVRIQEKSLMPEGFGSNIKIQEFRDLIRYVMANPFITDVDVNAFGLTPETMNQRGRPIVGVPGRIPIPDGDWNVVIRGSVTAPDSLKTKMLLGIRNGFTVKINGRAIDGKGSGNSAQPDQVGFEVALDKGENKFEIAFPSKGKGEAVYARFVDPDRKLRYPEPIEK